MKRMSKRLAPLLLTAVLAACSSSNGGASTTTASPDASPQSQQKQSAPPAESQPPKAVEKYNPPIELTTTMFNFGYPKFDDGEDMNNNRWSRAIEEQFGIKVKTLWDVPIDQFEQKTGLMIASGDIPNFFAVTPAQFRQLYDAGLIEDLTNVYKNYVPEATKTVIDNAGAEVLQSAYIDGKLMAIPWTGIAKDEVPVLWVRKDWFEKLQMTAPKSMADVLAMSEAFATRDPDGNNKNDTFGLGMNNVFDGRILGFLNGYHAYKGIWMDDGSGNLAYSSIQPAMRTALEQLQKLYKAGQIDREFGVKSTEKMHESVGEGKIGMYFAGMGEAAGALYKITPETEWISFPVPSADDKMAKLQHGPNIYNYFWVVKKGTKNPEALFKLSEMWLKYFYNSETKEEKEYFRDTPTTGYWMNAPFKLYQSIRGGDTAAITAVLRGEKDVTSLSISQLAFYERVKKYEAGDKTEWPMRWQYGLNGSGEIALLYQKNDQYMGDRFLTTPTETMVMKMPSLKKMEEEMIHTIIMGAPIEKFDSFVAEWKKLGGDEITAEVNKWYRNR